VGGFLLLRAMAGPRIRSMLAREAKDFLVRETAKQAELEGAPLSELEKRMMYFVENEDMGEDPIALNAEFEAAYDSDEYETKISGLLHRAYARVRKENPEAGKLWMAAIKELSRGDHYLPVLWGSPLPGYRAPRQARPPYDQLKLFGTAIVVACAMFGFAALWERVSGRFPNSPIRNSIVRRLVLYAAVILYFVFQHLWRGRKRRRQESAGQDAGSIRGSKGPTRGGR
jgi:hypothetical protein